MARPLRHLVLSEKGGPPQGLQRERCHGDAPRAAGENGTVSELRIGPVSVGSPVVLAPMAGVTNPPFRKLCREAGLAALDDAARATARPGEHAPAGLYVTEMVTPLALAGRRPGTLRMAHADPEGPRPSG